MKKVLNGLVYTLSTLRSYAQELQVAMSGLEN